MARDHLLTYPDFNETFKFCTNAREFQLGAVIIQKGKLIYLYSRKITDARKRCIVTEKYLLSIVESIKEFIIMLLGKNLGTHTYHKNPTCNNFNTNIVIIWQLILEEYGPDI